MTSLERDSHAPALILISGNVPGQWIIEDCSLAAENLMLAAQASGKSSAVDMRGNRIEIVFGLAGTERIAGVGAFLLKAELAKGEAEHGH